MDNNGPAPLLPPQPETPQRVQELPPTSLADTIDSDAEEEYVFYAVAATEVREHEENTPNNVITEEKHIEGKNADSKMVCAEKCNGDNLLPM
ncbi:hypothetical protein RJT34_09657 [Clitoria ternatea]|uniref:Uncharacterized protein n=1 Tax=Clitoria ternatea TaxID=43366 RepID=A0AAN9PUR6_CLITE